MVRLGFLLIICLVAEAFGQASFPAAEAAYQGENVTAIDLVANPHVDVEPFRALVEQKAGEPYVQDKVQASASALERTGKFGAVRTSVLPEPQGLRLTFVLEPAYYLGMVEFPELAKHFSYVRLLQVADFSGQDPYDKYLLPGKEAALTKFLAENGYFEAQVHAETRLDDMNQLANVTFRVRLGRRAKIGIIQIQGTNQAETTHLLHSVRSVRARFSGGLLKEGKTFTASRIKEATNLIKKSLASQNYLASKVEEQPPSYHGDTNRVDLAFSVELGPVVIVRTTGARLALLPFMSGRQKRKLIPIYSEGAIDRDLVSAGQQNLIDYFQKKGYFDVKVNLDYKKDAERIAVTYDIDKGKKHKVAKVAFQGTHELSSANLLAQIPVKKAHIITHGTYSDKLVQTSLKNIKALYYDIGYEDVKVTSQVVDHEPKVDVTFDITEGPRTIVENVSVAGNDRVPLEQLTGKDGLRLRPGSPFSPGKMASDRNQISAAYLDRGYLNSEVKAAVSRVPGNPHQVNVNYQITENQVVRMNSVLYMGEKHTRISLLRSTSRLKPETTFSEAELLAAQTRLYDLNIFDWASISPKKPITDQTEADTLVKVHEAKRTDITYGFGFEVAHRGGNVPAGTVAVPGLPPINIGNRQVAPSQATYASPQGSIEITRRNMRGLAETASFALLADQLDQRVLGTYADPDFRGTQWNGLTSLSFERTTENPLFAAQLSDGAFQLERILGKATDRRLQFRYDFNYTSLSQLLVPALVLPRDRNVNLSTASSAFIRDTRDKPLDAHHGSYSTVNLGITPTAFGSSANFARLFSQYAFYKPFHGIVFANSIRLGFDKALLGSFVPTSQLFFAGGGTTLRGFPIDEAGPQRIVPFCNVLTGSTTPCVPVTVPVGGRQLFILNSELRFPLKMILSALGGVIFYDGGNVYSAINFNQFVNDYTSTVGIGLRYATPVGPVRIDFGHRLNRIPGISENQYFITLGQSF
jgi:outer membrane protein insertion porin family